MNSNFASVVAKIVDGDTAELGTHPRFRYDLHDRWLLELYPRGGLDI
jgi:hypothetical protein